MHAQRRPSQAVHHVQLSLPLPHPLCWHFSLSLSLSLTHTHTHTHLENEGVVPRRQVLQQPLYHVVPVGVEAEGHRRVSEGGHDEAHLRGRGAADLDHLLHRAGAVKVHAGAHQLACDLIGSLTAWAVPGEWVIGWVEFDSSKDEEQNGREGGRVRGCIYSLMFQAERRSPASQVCLFLAGSVNANVTMWYHIFFHAKVITPPSPPVSFSSG